MGRARVNLQDIKNFELNSRNEGLAATQIKSALQEIDIINADIDKATTLIETTLFKCQKTETYITNIVDELQAKHDMIQAELNDLISSEPIPKYTEEEITECEYDDEGNVISSYTYTILVETSEHVSWACEVSQVQAELSTITAKLDQSKIMQLKIVNKIAQLKKNIIKLHDIKKNNDMYSEELMEYCLKIINSSQTVSLQLNRAVTALELYLAEMVNIVASPLCANFSWGQEKTPDAKDKTFVDNTGTTVYQSDEGMRVTRISSPSSLADLGNKKYTEGVVFEGNITFKYDHVEHTVAIKRKIYQYADGIDLDYRRTKDGKTNREVMLAGGSPTVLISTPEGVVETTLELHHLTQQETTAFPDAPFSQGGLLEIPHALHQNYTKTIHIQYPREKGVLRSFRKDKGADHKYKFSKDHVQFNKFRKLYWRTRALMEYDIKKQ